MLENIVGNKATTADMSYSRTEHVQTSHLSGKVAKQDNSLIEFDLVTLSYSSETSATYNNSMMMQGDLPDATELLRGLVLNIFEEQGLDSKIAAGDTEVNLNTLTPGEAQDLIADDGYFGVEKTSERIFEFAVGIAGGDPARIAAVREGVENGFQEALNAFGGWLPDISYDTYDAVMNKLDDWAGLDSNPKSKL